MNEDDGECGLVLNVVANKSGYIMYIRRMFVEGVSLAMQICITKHKYQEAFGKYDN